MPNDNLPDKFLFSHDFCFYLHDLLVDILKSGEVADIFSHQWQQSIDEEVVPSNLAGEELVEWLQSHGRKDIVFGLYFKQICAALLADMLNFVFEALVCSAKGKLTVAYALLRKPFKENLFFLEWLLADPGGMLVAFDGSHHEKSINKRFSDVQKKDLIERAIKETDGGEWFPAELIYDIRYNKNFSAGFETLFQKSNHLVTSFRFMETEKSNFNFIFSDDESWKSQWDGLYSFLPILLFHTIQIVESIIAKFARRVEGVDLTSVRTMIGLAFWLERGPHAGNSKPIYAAIGAGLREIPCPRCSHPLDDSTDQLLNLYLNNRLSCLGCNWVLDMQDLRNAEQ